MPDAFADALRAAMQQKRLTASDLARAVWGEKTDKRGYKVARNRDRIGQYLTGKLPNAENLAKLEEALGVSLPADRPVKLRQVRGHIAAQFKVSPDYRYHHAFIDMKFSGERWMQLLKLVGEQCNEDADA